MEECEYKVVFLGESNTGAKTSLIDQLIDNEFDPNSMSTCAPNFVSIIIQNDLGFINLKVWDTIGQEKYRSLVKIFIKGSHCVILGSDITNKYSFEEINYHYNNAKNILDDEPLIYLVANKIDLYSKHEVSEK